MAENIVILGAGYGGISAAQKLAKLTKKEDDKTITLIDKNPFHTLLTEIHKVAGNKVEEDGVKIDLEKLFSSTKVNVVSDYIKEMDFENKVLKSDNYKYEYDYLITGTGSEPSNCGVEGIFEHTFTLWSIDDAKKIKNHIYEVFQEARITQDQEVRKELLTFVVCGGGFTGVEMMGELKEWVSKLCQKYQIPEQEVELILCEGLDNILPNLGEKMADEAANYLYNQGVQIRTGAFVNEAQKNKLILEDGEINSRTIIWTCGVQGANIAANSGLATDNADRIQVNEYLQTVDYPEVYAVGDNAAAPAQNGETLPALVEAAMQTGECAAENIYNDIKGKSKEEITPNLHGVMVSIGSEFAVAEIMGLSIKGKPAMLMKHMVNMHYLFDIGKIKEGFSFINEYIKDHGSRKGLISQLFDQGSIFHRAIFLVPLRIMVGIMWLLSGLDKINNYWLSSPDKLVAGSTVQPIGPDPVGLYVDFMEAVIFPNSLFFQYVIVLTELFIATSLILGLFSSLGALTSAGLAINLSLSGFFFANPELKWYLMASIALIGNSGRVLGLDYYILPWLKNLIWRSPSEKNEDIRKVVEKENSPTA